MPFERDTRFLVVFAMGVVRLIFSSIFPIVFSELFDNIDAVFWLVVRFVSVQLQDSLFYYKSI